MSPDQWPTWRDVRLRALEDAPEAFGASLADWSGAGDTAERWRGRLDDVAANFVAYLDDQPVGQVSGAQWDDGDQVDLISMWVAPEARGLGVGDALVEAVARWGTEVGARSVALMVKVDNDPAIGLYKRHGYRRTDTPEQEGEIEMVKYLR